MYVVWYRQTSRYHVEPPRVRSSDMENGGRLPPPISRKNLSSSELDDDDDDQRWAGSHPFLALGGARQLEIRSHGAVAISCY